MLLFVVAVQAGNQTILTTKRNEIRSFFLCACGDALDQSDCSNQKISFRHESNFSF